MATKKKTIELDEAKSDPKGGVYVYKCGSSTLKVSSEITPKERRKAKIDFWNEHLGNNPWEPKPAE